MDAPASPSLSSPAASSALPAPDRTKPDPAQTVPPRAMPAGWLRRWWRRLAWTALLLVVGIGLLPTIVAQTELRQALPHLLRPDLPDGCSLGAATLAWHAPVVLHDVRIPDMEGKPLLFIRELRTDRPLWELVASPADVGRIRLLGCDCQVRLRPDGSNLGDLLRRLRRTTSDGPTPRVRLEWSDSRLQVSDQTGRRLTELIAVSGVWDDLTGGGAPVQLTLAAAAAPAPSAGRLTVAATWQGPARPGEGVGPGELQLQFRTWPLEDLQSWLAPLLNAAALAGDGSLAVHAKWEALTRSGAEATLRCELTDLQALVQPLDPDQPPRELVCPRAAVALQAAYDDATDAFTLRASQIASPWGECQLSGALTDLRGVCQCDLSGAVTIDLQPWLERLDPAWRRQVRIEGLRTNRVTLRGPLCIRELPADRERTPPDPGTGFTAEAEVAWDHAEAYGVTSDDARLIVRYVAGDGRTARIMATPTEVPVSGGRLVAVPVLELREPELVAVLPQGPVLERVRFTEELCRGWLRYLSPLMANATSASGTFSLSVEPLEVGLSSPFPPEGLRGTLTIHEARFGPGPIALAVLELVQQVRGMAGRGGREERETSWEWVTVAQQPVAFAVREGRAWHSGLTTLIGPVELRSEGSVGLTDESLDLHLVARFPESWFTNRPLLAALQGDGLRVTIGGTLQHPRIEGRPLLEFGRGAGLRATGAVLQHLLKP